MPNSNKNDHMTNHLSQLAGGTVVSAVDDGGKNERNRVYGLKIRKADGAEVIAWVLRDPEGNGPGYLDIEEVT